MWRNDCAPRGITDARVNYTSQSFDLLLHMYAEIKVEQRKQ